ncbi:acyl-CoA dehydrogenase family protein [Mycolicibacterium fluoranthenivorans]|uniref:Acyl-CoA dehydrogenase family protein n=1 Tax=Mycolicibacterium fluoranthenivorans TaxID=258505 RepID=A0A7G8PGB5_9MYCO|nr:acyl-CoA dehydrogenase family protein [Mycolicibacterium fluoranthenivorans]QNJ93381.1 acyl-CoA dehydrogenase family protein [Mycolicibacterium fluoranthenivorans]
MTSVQTPAAVDADLASALTAEDLFALMRSTWTWDDRALRRDLAALLVDLDAARLCPQAALAEVLHYEALHRSATFVGTVLGPKLIADTGNPLRQKYIDAAADPAALGRAAATARAAAAGATVDYVAAQVSTNTYPLESGWRRLIAEQGTTGLATAMRSAGHSLSDSNFFASFGLAWQMLTTITRSESGASLAQRLLNGEIDATLAAAEQTGSWDPVLVKTRATPTETGWRLDGVKHFVPGADTADVILVVGRSVAGPSVFAVDRTAPGVSVTPHPVLDATRPLFEVSCTNTPATILGREGAGGRFMFEALGRATTALAGEQIGLIERAVQHLTTHNGADLTDVAIQHAKAVGTWQAAVDKPTPERAATAHIAASAAALAVTEQVAELVGPSPETAALQHRAISANLLFGGPAVSHERLLERLGL